MAAILTSAIMNLAIFDSAILVFPLKLTHTCQDRFPLFAHKINFTHSFWLKLMMAATLNSVMFDSDTAILDSDTLLSSLRFTQKQSHSTLSLTQTNSIWLKLIHSHSTLMMAAILNSAILNSAIFDSNILNKKNFTHSFSLYLMITAIFNSTTLDSAILHKINFTHSFWLSLMMAAILNSAILDSDTAMLDSDTAILDSDTLLFLSDSLKNTLTPLCLWLKLI